MSIYSAPDLCSSKDPLLVVYLLVGMISVFIPRLIDFIEIEIFNVLFNKMTAVANLIQTMSLWEKGKRMGTGWESVGEAAKNCGVYCVEHTTLQYQSHL